jgi:hypothetical protein
MKNSFLKYLAWILFFFLLTNPILAQKSAPARLDRAHSFFGVHFDFHADTDCKEIGKRVSPQMVNEVIDQIHPDFIQIDWPGDYRQLDIRLRGHSKNVKQMFIMFNPISITHWLKGEFFDHKKNNATVIETTYKDNKFLDKESIRVLEAFKDTDEYYYMVYCLGAWGVIGKTVFNAKIVSERILYLKEHK